MREIHYCNRCENKFATRVVAEVICPRCRATSGVSRLDGALRRRRLGQVRFGVVVLLAGFVFLLWILRREREDLARHSVLALLTDAEIDRKYAADVRLLRIYAEGLDHAVALAEHSPDLFSTTRLRELDPNARRRLGSIWSSVLDYCVALDSLKDFYSDFWRISALTRRARHTRSYILAYGACLAQYLHGMRFVRLVAGNSTLENMLDEPVSELGIPAKAFHGLKWRILHVVDASRIFAGHEYHRLVTDPGGAPDLPRDEETRWLLASEPEWFRRIEESYDLEGAGLVGRNALDLLEEETFEKWFPIQKEVAEWMGDTRLIAMKAALITEEQLHEMQSKLEPGDVLVERRNWFLSNVGLPGFWPHAALYVGSAEDFEAYFRDAEVDTWLRSLPAGAGSLLEHLRRTRPEKARAYESPHPHDHRPIRILEAVSEGGLMSSFEESMSSDYLAAMRPRLSKLDKAKAILKAFENVGAPYDFNFDFLTDSSIVCSELVYKAYLPEQDKPGLHFALIEVLGRMTLPANEIVHAFDEEYDTPRRQLDFVWFLDGSVAEGKAVTRDAEALRASWRRPKWDILQE